MCDGNCSILKKARIRLNELIEKNGFTDKKITVSYRTLSPEEAIGNPQRRDYPIIEGKEKVIEAEFMGVKTHVFTDSPAEYTGSLEDIMGLRLDNNRERAIFIAALNAVMKKTGLISDTMHCKDEEPEKCSKQISEYILERWGKVSVGLIGFNPAIAETLIGVFGKNAVGITDLNRKNIGAAKFGVTIWDGYRDTEKLIKTFEAVIFTGTTAVNGTFDSILSLITKYNRHYLIYGVTAAGLCCLFNMDRVCYYGRE
ncbi:MAG: DUF364 domain-containing protein [Elusimicrobiota bacterium]